MRYVRAFLIVLFWGCWTVGLLGDEGTVAEKEYSDVLTLIGNNRSRRKFSENIPLLQEFIKKYPQMYEASCFLISTYYLSDRYLSCSVLGEEILNIMSLESFGLTKTKLNSSGMNHEMILYAIEAYRRSGKTDLALKMQERLKNVLLRSGWSQDEYKSLVKRQKQLFEPMDSKRVKNAGE